MGLLDSFRREESGAVLVLVTLSMLVLLLIAGLVLDLGAVRTHRANQQLVSDSAAAAGALAVATTGSGEDACEAAKAYVLLNLPQLTSLTGIDCTGFPAACTSLTAETIATTTEAGITVSIAYPVADGSTFMESRVMGAAAQPTSAEDGDQCERVAVAISSDYETGFIRIAGYNELPANVHTVAKAQLPTGDSVPINLLVLDRTGCQTLHVHGTAGILVEAIYHPDIDGAGTPGLIPGVAAADSDGSDCKGNEGVIHLKGSPNEIRADGPEGCSNQSGSYFVSTPSGPLLAGEGCGRVQTVAPGTPGCGWPACHGSNTPNPEPTALPGRLTRAPIDHRYNCKEDYSTLDPSLSWATDPLTVASGQDIAPCPEAPPDNDHIHDLIRAVGPAGAPPGFQTWSDCNVQPSDVIEVEAGDWYVDCSSFAVRGTITFKGGNVVFGGDVTVQGRLAINSTPALAPASQEAWVFLRDGAALTKSGSGILVMHNTTLYASKDATINLQGNGRLTWIAPNTGDFDDLALWSDSNKQHIWRGVAQLDLEGVFFTPLATADYLGTSGQEQVKAQFIANKLHVGGTATLVVTPEFGRAVEFPADPQTNLIR